jgi:acetyl-CoA carboxylase biotin carboxyl carrier protein
VKRAGRLHAPEIEVLVVHAPGGPPGEPGPPIIELRAPHPGGFVPWIAPGDRVSPGGAIGELVVLGRASALIVPRSGSRTGELATGIAIRLVPATHPVGYGDVLVALDPSMQLAAGPGTAAAVAASTVEGLVFRAPTSGRFYSRPAADKPPFVAEGSPLAAGTTVCLLEVMKTFHRVTYGGAGLPDTARVSRVLVADGADVSAGDPLLALE